MTAAGRRPARTAKLPIGLASKQDGADREAAPYVIVELPGQPRGWHTITRIIYPPGKKAFAHEVPDTNTKRYMRDLAKIARSKMLGRPLLSGPVGVGVLCTFTIPKSWPERRQADALSGLILPTVKPDWDNMGKMCDAFKDVVWIDDAQIADGHVVKQYGQSPSMRFEIFRLQPRAPLFG